MFAALATEVEDQDDDDVRQLDDQFTSVSYRKGRRRNASKAAGASDPGRSNQSPSRKGTSGGAQGGTRSRGMRSAEPAPPSGSWASVASASSSTSPAGPDEPELFALPASLPALSPTSSFSTPPPAVNPWGTGPTKAAGKPQLASSHSRSSSPSVAPSAQSTSSDEEATISEAYAKCLQERKRPSREQVDVVLYHKYCTDGFGAAWAAWKLLGDRAEYIACCHGEPPPKNLEGKNVVIADFSFPLAQTLYLVSITNSFLILDHHVSARAVLSSLPPELAVFDMLHSGARLAWDFFWPETPVPDLIHFIEDRDLWRFTMPNSKQFFSGFEAVPFTFEAYDAFLQQEVIDACIERGTILYDYVNIQLNQHLKRSVIRTFEGYRVRVVNATSWLSEVGNLLALQEDCEFALVWNYSHRRREYLVSLRACTDDVDLSQIAAKYGGGGHIRAAGMRWCGDIEALFAKKP
eukprot:CAMPEP_0177635944 /NCGR_PEP_ID=MMETSP0447-20121125/4173_1 /TAXON_ID=0 /ORGANISM="Stygamoeba regulata, Strain BSH-02190019" /LENGTH=463 /DNA_ID=CAMNT_0019137769 /DNA_START=104 /DNA_END=1495 /DNA_ORIENTATION=-